MKQKNMAHKEEKNQSAETNTELTQMLKLTEVLAVIISVFYIRKTKQKHGRYKERPKLNFLQ